MGEYVNYVCENVVEYTYTYCYIIIVLVRATTKLLYLIK